MSEYNPPPPPYEFPPPYPAIALPSRIPSLTTSEMDIETFNPVKFIEATRGANVVLDTPGPVLPAVTVDAPPATPIKAFDVLIWVSGAGCKAKQQKQDPLAFGPMTLDTSLSWADFLPCLAAEVQTAADTLMLSSLEWRYQKPANSLWIPLRAEASYVAMVKQMATARSPGIIIHMDPPRAAAIAALPWAQTAPRPSAAADEHESDDNDNCDSRRKKSSKSSSAPSTPSIRRGCVQSTRTSSASITAPPRNTICLTGPRSWCGLHKL
ncbi:hypothetical protein FIBSPDRAFT_987102 [Athelia psychrophila]|uniref:Uncharacterized protein n=1 Tax=Athelia psychrophila TaxID=1759441 RepID=A0A166SPX6_9AGAM|nr:hypothetical protein FIBSPDRAFT_987102 [Fibularhizoctonia sp. CBS 109695]